MPTKKMCHGSARLEVISSFLAAVRGAGCIPRTAASPSGRTASARGKGSEKRNFRFPPSRYISRGLRNKRHQLGAGTGPNVAQQYLPLLK